MARKKSTNLTEAELRLMDVIWEKGSATVAEVGDALPRQLGLAYNTVQTMLRLMEDKGLVEHHAQGRTFIYTPRFSREDSRVGRPRLRGRRLASIVVDAEGSRPR